MREQRETLKTYFENGDRPSQNQFAQLIDSYVHLNELNFGLSVRPSGHARQGYYHFYEARDVQFSGMGHKIVKAPFGSNAGKLSGYRHLLSRMVMHKELICNIQGAIDLVKHKPKIIIERYKQKKKLDTGYVKPAGFYKEEMRDAMLWNRKSEYDVTSKEMTIDLAPIYYFRPSHSFKTFQPSGSIRKSGSYRYSKHRKPFVPIQIKLQITIDGIDYTSHPINLKIVLGSNNEYDAINFAFD